MEKKRKVRRSAITGKFVSEEEVEQHPETTITETVHVHEKEEEPEPPPDG